MLDIIIGLRETNREAERVIRKCDKENAKNLKMSCKVIVAWYIYYKADIAKLGSTWTPGARQRDFLYGGEEGPCKDIAINFDSSHFFRSQEK